MIWTDLRAHQPQVAMFRRALQRGRTAHAYLFVGPSGVGKRTVALRIAQCLFCQRHAPEELEACGDCPACRQVRSGTHPDLLTIGLPPGKKELPIAALLGEGDKRGREGLLRDLSLKPMSATRRIAIIDDADRMSEESANALLKTLEEPPPGAILFLISPSRDSLLPTIRSRCQPLQFGPLPAPDVAELLVAIDREIEPAAAAEAARICEGSLDTARQLLDPGLRELRTTLHTVLCHSPFDPVSAAQQLLKALDELDSGAAGLRDSARWLLRFSMDFLRLSLSPEPEVSDAVARFRRIYPAENTITADRLAMALERSFEAEVDLLQSMPVPLCLEAWLHDLGRVLRGSLVV